MSVATDPRVTEIMQAVSRYGKLRAANAPIVVTDRAYRTVVELVIQALYPEVP